MLTDLHFNKVLKRVLTPLTIRQIPYFRIQVSQVINCRIMLLQLCEVLFFMLYGFVSLPLLSPAICVQYKSLGLCDSNSKLRQVVAVLPQGHTLTLMCKFGDDDNTILYYALECTSKDWNRELLSSAISLQMHKRKNEPSDNNFEQTLPAAQAMFANEVF